MQRATLRRLLAATVTASLALLPATALAHERHEVQSGETLSGIARSHGHPTGAWQELAAENADVIDNPDLLFPGMELSVPENLDDVEPASAPADEDTTSTQETTATQSTAWDRLAECESGGQWGLNTGTYDGGLQFHPDTWTAYGGDEFATYAHQASRAEQITVAERVRAGQGWGAWPACSAELGLG